MNIKEFGNYYLPELKSELMIEALADSVGFVTTNYLTLMFPLFLAAAVYLTYTMGFKDGRAEFNFISMGIPILAFIVFIIWYFEFTVFIEGFNAVYNFIIQTLFY